MATAKSTTKKTAPKKSTIKRSAPKRSASKSTPVSKATRARRMPTLLRSEDVPFMTFKVTRQTLYWAVLGAVVILFTVWLMQLQSDIQALYDQIDANTAEMSEL